MVQQQLCEAALYVSGRPLDLKTLGSVIGARSEDKIRTIAQAVAERYRGADSPIQVLELPDGRFVMQLKGEFARTVKKLATRPVLVLVQRFDWSAGYHPGHTGIARHPP